MSIIMSVDELYDRIQAGAKTTVLACQWLPGEHRGYAEFRKGHIPTAVFFDPPSYLAGTPGADFGRNPLPSIESLRRGFEDCGINSSHHIVVYDSNKGILAGRAWWVLKWAGVNNVSILDGQLEAWERAEYDIMRGPGNFPQNCDVTPEIGSMPEVTIDELFDTDKTLVDVREQSRFAGKNEILDMRAGHIPGAVNVPLDKLLLEDHTFNTPSNIRHAFRKVGVNNPENAIIYSGSGLHSALAIAAMHYAGLEGASHFVGGWSQWCGNKDNPVEVSF